jgi:hypothetical protein
MVLRSQVLSVQRDLGISLSLSLSLGEGGVLRSACGITESHIFACDRKYSREGKAVSYLPFQCWRRTLAAICCSFCPCWPPRRLRSHPRLRLRCRGCLSPPHRRHQAQRLLSHSRLHRLHHRHHCLRHRHSPSLLSPRRRRLLAQLRPSPRRRRLLRHCCLGHSHLLRPPRPRYHPCHHAHRRPRLFPHRRPHPPRRPRRRRRRDPTPPLWSRIVHSRSRRIMTSQQWSCSQAAPPPSPSPSPFTLALAAFATLALTLPLSLPLTLYQVCSERSSSR